MAYMPILVIYAAHLRDTYAYLRDLTYMPILGIHAHAPIVGTYVTFLWTRDPILETYVPILEHRRQF